MTSSLHLLVLSVYIDSFLSLSLAIIRVRVRRRFHFRSLERCASLSLSLSLPCLIRETLTIGQLMRNALLLESSFFICLLYVIKDTYQVSFIGV